MLTELTTNDFPEGAVLKPEQNIYDQKPLDELIFLALESTVEPAGYQTRPLEPIAGPKTFKEILTTDLERLKQTDNYKLFEAYSSPKTEVEDLCRLALSVIAVALWEDEKVRDYSNEYWQGENHLLPTDQEFPQEFQRIFLNPSVISKRNSILDGRLDRWLNSYACTGAIYALLPLMINQPGLVEYIAVNCSTKNGYFWTGRVSNQEHDRPIFTNTYQEWIFNKLAHRESKIQRDYVDRYDAHTSTLTIDTPNVDKTVTRRSLLRRPTNTI